MLHWISIVFDLGHCKSGEGRDTRWHNWLRQCATSLKVAGSIPDGAIGCPLVLVSTQPLKELSTMDTTWGLKAAGA